MTDTASNGHISCISFTKVNNKWVMYTQQLTIRLRCCTYSPLSRYRKRRDNLFDFLPSPPSCRFGGGGGGLISFIAIFPQAQSFASIVRSVQNRSIKQNGSVNKTKRIWMSLNCAGPWGNWLVRVPPLAKIPKILTASRENGLRYSSSQIPKSLRKTKHSRVELLHHRKLQNFLQNSTRLEGV